MNARSFARRAFWLFCAGVCFYALGAGMVLALLWLPRYELATRHDLSLAGVLCGVAALWVVIGFLPRFERKVTRKPALAEGEHPRLQAFIADVARRVGQRGPDEVRLFLAANAYAALRSRFPPWRRGEVGLGLPMLVFLERDELASVIAHELGHHIAGDVLLGPWVHRTRRSIGGALEHLDGSSFFLHLPFAAYGDLFLKASQEVSRAQELHADRIAGNAFGQLSAARALELTHEQGLLWMLYLEREVLPVVSAGFLPPLLEGFRRFRAALASEQGAGLAKMRQADLRPSSAYDSHPSLGERLAALGVEAAGAQPRGDCLDLLDDAERSAEALVRDELTGGKKLQPLAWEETSERVIVPNYRSLLENHARRFAELAPSALPAALAEIDTWVAHFRGGFTVLSPEAERRRALIVFGAWFVLTLREHGFAIQSDVGCPIRAAREAHRLEPFAWIEALASGEISAAEWQRRCTELALP